MCSHIRLLLVALIVVAPPLSLQAQNLNIDFGAHFGTPSDAFGAVSGQTGRWNAVGLGATYNLENTSTAPTAVSITVSAQTAGAYGNGCPWGTDLESLGADNFYVQAGKWEVTLAGLANGSYEVFLYAPNSDSVGSGTMLINGIAVAEIPGDTLCDMTEGFGSTKVEVDVVNGTLSMMGDSVGTWRFYAGLAGVQLKQGPADIFVDGFESGDTTTWSSFVP